MREIYLYDVFTNQAGKGNSTAIIYTLSEIADSIEYQELASELKVSEVTVVKPLVNQEYDYELRFFAPREEVNFCGHGTIGALAFLFENNDLDRSLSALRIKTKAGLIEGGVKEPGLYYMKQQLPEFSTVPVCESKIAEILHISESNFLNYHRKLPLQIVSTGRSKLIIPIQDVSLLFSIKPDFNEMEKYCRQVDTNGFHLFAFGTVSGKKGLTVRHFAPTAGVLEDPVTGNANGALGAYLVNHDCLGDGNEIKIYIEQGHLLQKEGFLWVDISRDISGVIDSVEVSGTAVVKTGLFR